MDFERQKPVSDEYRENWERVFAPTQWTWIWNPEGEGLRIFKQPLHQVGFYERDPQKDDL